MHPWPWFAHDAGAKSFIMYGKLRFRAACPGTRVHLPRSLPPPQNLVDIGHADPENGRRSISARSGIHRRHDTLAQVLRIGSPHHGSPRRINDDRESKISPHWNPRAIPSTTKM